MEAVGTTYKRLSEQAGERSVQRTDQPTEAEKVVSPPPPQSRWRAAAAPLGVAGLAVAGCAYVAITNPNQSTLLPQCPLRMMTGLDCPGCGLTRSVYALMNGDVVRALDHNVLLVVMLPLLLWAYVSWTAGLLGVALPSPRWRPWMGWALGALALGFLVVRNIPAWSWLGSDVSA